MSKKRIQAKIPNFLLDFLPDEDINSEIIEEAINKLYEHNKEFLQLSQQESSLDKRSSSFYISEDTYNKFKELLDAQLYRSNAGLITTILKREYIQDKKSEEKPKKKPQKSVKPTKKQIKKTKKKLSTLQELKQLLRSIKLTPEAAKFGAELYEDFQEIRLSTANRLRALVKNKTDLKKVPSDEKLFDRMDDLLMKKQIDKDTYNNLYLYRKLIKEIRSLEAFCKKIMKKGVKDHPVYKKFLSKIRGIGPVFSANLIKEFGDCSQYETVSKLWAHTGNHVVNGKAPRKRKGKKINFDPDLRQLTWKISKNLMMQNKGFYREEYEDEVKKQLQKTYNKGYLHKKYGKSYKSTDTKLSKHHAMNRAMRKIRKIFLDHLWHVARESAGLSAEKNYVEGVLEHEHITTWKEAIEQENKLLSG